MIDDDDDDDDKQLWPARNGVKKVPEEINKN